MPEKIRENITEGVPEWLEKLLHDVDAYVADHYVEEPEKKLRFHLPRSKKQQAAMGRIPAPMCALPARSLEDVMNEVGETFQQRLLRLVDMRGLTDVEVYKKANLDRKLFSKIRCNVNYVPKKITAVALAVALELNLDETKDLLGRAGIALSPCSKFDLIIEYFISNEVYDVYTINTALLRHGQPMLGEQRS